MRWEFELQLCTQKKYSKKTSATDVHMHARMHAHMYTTHTHAHLYITTCGPRMQVI